MVVTPAERANQAGAHRYVALDSLRGIAALAVAVFHIQARDGFTTLPFFRASNQFVDFFFVLSGFVIARAYGDRLAAGFPIRTFLWLRLGRVWPLHFAVLLVYIAIECALALTGLSHGGRVPFTDTRDPWALIPTVLLIQAFVMPGVGTWNTQSWSISVELGLYLVWACAWRALGRFAVLLAVLVALLLLAAWEVRSDVIGNQVWAMRGFAGFGLGMGVCAIERRVSGKGGALPIRTASGLEAAALAGLVLVVNPQTPLYASDLLFAALVLVFAFGRGWFARLLCTAPFVFLGTISYSLYMVHGFVIGRALDVLTLVQRWTGARLVEHGEGTMGTLLTPAWATDLLAVAMLALAVATAWLAWRWVEQPCRGWSRQWVGAAT